MTSISHERPALAGIRVSRLHTLDTGLIDVAENAKRVNGQRHEFDQVFDLRLVDAQPERVSFTDAVAHLRGEAFGPLRLERRVASKAEPVGGIRSVKPGAAGQHERCVRTRGKRPQDDAVSFTGDVSSRKSH